MSSKENKYNILSTDEFIKQFIDKLNGKKHNETLDNDVEVLGDILKSPLIDDETKNVLKNVFDFRGSK